MSANANSEAEHAAQGGRELMLARLTESMPPALLERFQIVSGATGVLDAGCIRILWCHDLPSDQQNAHLANGGWQRFHKLVFVSHWQMQGYVERYAVPYSHCSVILNGIVPIPAHAKPQDEIRLAYWSTPHRGLAILVPVFTKLAEKYPGIALDVFSSYAVYGQPDHDAQFAALFEACRAHPRIAYHGAVPNDALRQALTRDHILAYPSIWPETSCLVLIEAMSAGMAAVHPAFAALPETAGGLSEMYPWHENSNAHANLFYRTLDRVIAAYHAPEMQARLALQKARADAVFGWDGLAAQWRGLLESLLQGAS